MKTFICIISLFLFSNLAFAAGFTLTSEDISGQLSDNQVFSGFGCDGKNISPQLKWFNPPKGTKSFAVTVYDPDAPTGSGWWHWIIFNIPKNVDSLDRDAGIIKKNIAPKGSVQSITSYGIAGYGGACPPEGDNPHRYIFTVFALDIEMLQLDARTTPALVGFMLNQHVLAKSSLIAYYAR